MGTYCDSLDDESVEMMAYALCRDDGCDDPERMTYEYNEGVPEPYGPVWTRYIDDAITALLGPLSARPAREGRA